MRDDLKNNVKEYQNNNSIENNNFEPSLKQKLIYIFRINDETHKGFLKIGDATINAEDFNLNLEPNSELIDNAAKERIDSYTSTAGIAYELLHTELAVFMEKNILKAFRDYQVHELLTRSGLKKKYFDTNKKQNEWFKVDLETAKNAIKAVKEGKKALSNDNITNDQNPIVFRPEQKAAIDKTKKHFRRSSKMLWNAKMRFGKTLCALQVVKELKFSKTLILTHRPVVKDSWYEDFTKIFYSKPDYGFASKIRGDSIQNLIKTNKKFVYFASMQDLRGSVQVGGNIVKNQLLFEINWDFIVIDESHEGTQTSLGKNVLEELSKPYNDFDTKILELSGTPFNRLSNFEDESIYTWDYIMEQEAKQNWSKNTFGDHNPYAELPKLNIYTYHLEKNLTGFINIEDKAFNFREFFRTWTGDINKDGQRVSDNKSIGDFVHEKDVNSFLDLISKKSSDSNYPFSNEQYREFFRHSLWMLPGVKEAKAFSKLLKNHTIFGNGAFNIVNVAGDGDEEVDSKDALEAVENAIGDNPEETYSITLSCGRLTTGVSVRPWTAVLMLSGSSSTSASQYLQTIFRVQTPANINGRFKENCYVFDFAPDRTLKMVAEVVELSAKTNTSYKSENQLGKFLNYCPIISVEETSMKKYRVANLLQELKKAYAERVVKNGFDDPRLYNDELLKLDNIDIDEFEILKKTIGASKQTKKIRELTVNDEGFTDEKYEELVDIEKKPKKTLTEEEKEALKELREKRKNRLNAITILRGISIRIPLMVYGLDIDINDDVTIDNFPELVDDLSWKEFMPDGVDKRTFIKFSKYYDKDIFISSSRKIRYIAKSADELEPFERIKKITELFSTFKNPDKETVLTPWKTVNKHLSNTLGGYVFFDEKFESKIIEPRLVLQENVTEEVYDNPESNILDINSKSGLYPLFMTYTFYRKKSEISTETDFKKRRKIWNDIVSKNIFVICKTPMAKSITKRTLVGYGKTKINAHYFEDLVNQLKQKNKLNNIINKIKNGRDYWKVEGKSKHMKFNAIIGNPPYQIKLNDNVLSQNTSTIYQLFVGAALKLEPDYLSLITPSRWMTGGRGLDKFREKMIKINSFVTLHDYVDTKELFTNVDIKGGISYWLIKNDHHDKCNYYLHEGNDIFQSKRYLDDFGIGMVIRDSKSINILKKIIESQDFVSFEKIAGSQTPFGIVTSFSDYKETKDETYNIKIYGNNFVGYTKKEYIKKNFELVNKYKVFVPKAVGSGFTKNDKIKPVIGDKQSICTQTYIAYGTFDSIEQARNLSDYMKTKFFHFLLGQLKNTHQMSPSMFKLTPMQNFNESWNDEKLYKKYYLEADEKKYIEQSVWDGK